MYEIEYDIDLYIYDPIDKEKIHMGKKAMLGQSLSREDILITFSEYNHEDINQLKISEIQFTKTPIIPFYINHVEPDNWSE